MWIVFCICESMMHTVHNAIAIRAQVIRTLENPSEYVKDLFGSLIHRECMMSSIAMKEKRLEKKRQVPVANKECKNDNHQLRILGMFPVRQGSIRVVTKFSEFFSDVVFKVGDELVNILCAKLIEQLGG